MPGVTWSDLPQEIHDMIFSHIVRGASQTQLKIPAEYTGHESKAPRIAGHGLDYYLITMPTAQRLPSSSYAGALLCDRSFNSGIKEAVREFDSETCPGESHKLTSKLDCLLLIPGSRRWRKRTRRPPIEVCIAWSSMGGHIDDRPARFQVNYRIYWEDDEAYAPSDNYQAYGEVLQSWDPQVQAVIKDVARYTASSEPWPCQSASSKQAVQTITSLALDKSAPTSQNSNELRTLTFELVDYDEYLFHPQGPYHKNIWSAPLVHFMYETDLSVAAWFEALFATMKDVEHDPRPWQDRVIIINNEEAIEYPE